MSADQDHASAAGAPGASGPGEPGYDGEATVGDEGAAAGDLSFVDPNGTPPDVAEAAARALHRTVQATDRDDRDDRPDPAS